MDVYFIALPAAKIKIKHIMKPAAKKEILILLLCNKLNLKRLIISDIKIYFTLHYWYQSNK